MCIDELLFVSDNNYDNISIISVKNVNVIIFIPLLVVHICIIIMINIKYVLYYLSSVAPILISAYTIDI